MGRGVQVRVQVSKRNWLRMNLRWFALQTTPKIVIDQVVPDVYFVANG
jgi:hypothetical protein